jgi:hypothetical protein
MFHKVQDTFCGVLTSIFYIVLPRCSNLIRMYAAVGVYKYRTVIVNGLKTQLLASYCILSLIYLDEYLERDIHSHHHMICPSIGLERDWKL